MTAFHQWFGAIALAVGLSVTAIPIAAQDRRVDEFEIEDYDYWADLCDELERSEKYPEALDACERAIEMQPGRKRRTIPVWVSRGNVLRDLENYEEALASYNHVLDLEPDYSLVWMYQCEVLVGMGRQELALAACERALEADGNWGDRSPAEAWRVRAVALRDRARRIARDTRDLRDRLLVSVAGIDPKDLTSPLYETAIADLEAVLWDLDEAAVSYERALTLEGDYALAWAQHCEVLTEIGRFQQLKGILTQEMAEGILFDRLYEDALASCEAALAIDRNWGEFNRAIAWRHRGGVLEAWAARQPNFRLGARYWEAAVNSYERALAIDPQSPEVWTRQAIVLQVLDRPEKALTSYNQALELAPDASQTLAYRCEVLNLLGEYQTALESCEGALNGDLEWEIENVAQAWNQRSAALIGLEDYEGALESVERAIALYDYPLSTRVYAPPKDGSPAEASVAFPTIDPRFLNPPEDPLRRCHGNLTPIVQRDFTRRLDRYRRALNNKAVSLWYLGRYGDARLYAQLALSPQSVRLVGVRLNDKDAADIACNYPQAWFNYGRILSAQGQYSAAINAYEMALNTYSLYLPPEAFRPLEEGRDGVRNACEFLLGNLGAATAVQTRHRRICANLFLNQSAAYWHSQGCAAAAGSCQAAVDAIRDAVSLSPDSVEVWFNYGLALMANGDFPEALQAFDRAQQQVSEAVSQDNSTIQARLVSGRARTLYEWATVVASETPDSATVTEALVLVEEALQLKPDYNAARQLRDRLLQSLGTTSQDGEERVR
ncbi:tetratricopeptide repeat protein [Baaleninema sp.]|uniref:tetratricopeptide repeat protein n=1 Tax=Baaleninema sp. TaxID=3101197 RepID=UPI003CFD1FD9